MFSVAFPKVRCASVGRGCLWLTLDICDQVAGILGPHRLPQQVGRNHAARDLDEGPAARPKPSRKSANTGQAKEVRPGDEAGDRYRTPAGQFLEASVHLMQVRHVLRAQADSLTPGLEDPTSRAPEFLIGTSVVAEGR